MTLSSDSISSGHMPADEDHGDKAKDVTLSRNSMKQEKSHTGAASGSSKANRNADRKQDRDEMVKSDACYLEDVHVRRVYDQIAPHIQDLRQRTWPKVKTFLKSLPAGSLVADVGCGNGRYMNINPSVVTVGLDSCGVLVEAASAKGLEVLCADNLSLPFRDGVFDAVLSVGVIHHFATVERRVLAIQELLRLLRKGGCMMIYVWAFEQKYRKFDGQDILVPWHKPRLADDSRRQWLSLLASSDGAGSMGSSVSDEDYPDKQAAGGDSSTSTHLLSLSPSPSPQTVASGGRVQDMHQNSCASSQVLYHGQQCKQGDSNQVLNSRVSHDQRCVKGYKAISVFSNGLDTSSRVHEEPCGSSREAETAGAVGEMLTSVCLGDRVHNRPDGVQTDYLAESCVKRGKPLSCAQSNDDNGITLSSFKSQQSVILGSHQESLSQTVSTVSPSVLSESSHADWSEVPTEGKNFDPQSPTKQSEKLLGRIGRQVPDDVKSALLTRNLVYGPGENISCTNIGFSGLDIEERRKRGLQCQKKSSRVIQGKAHQANASAVKAESLTCQELHHSVLASDKAATFIDVIKKGFKTIFSKPLPDNGHFLPPCFVPCQGEPVRVAQDFQIREFPGSSVLVSTCVSSCQQSSANISSTLLCTHHPPCKCMEGDECKRRLTLSCAHSALHSCADDGVHMNGLEHRSDGWNCETTQTACNGSEHQSPQESDSADVIHRDLGFTDQYNEHILHNTCTDTNGFELTVTKDNTAAGDETADTTTDGQTKASELFNSRLSRFYHVFCEGELEALIAQHIPGVQITQSFYDHANWCVVLKKD